jgi:RNA polymerase sigma-70 factor, ECF subfamily
MALRSARLDLIATSMQDFVTEPGANLQAQSADSLLIAAAQRGDRSAFGHLYERYAGMVHGVLLARVRAADVDDLLQDVFIRAMRHLSTLRDDESFGAWLRTIARNLANDYHRHSASEASLPDDIANMEDMVETPSQNNELHAATILNAIRSLPDAYRETLVLRLVEGMTGPEIAALTGLTHGSVRVNLHRGMQQLRVILGILPDQAGEQK